MVRRKRIHTPQTSETSVFPLLLFPNPSSKCPESSRRKFCRSWRRQGREAALRPGTGSAPASPTAQQALGHYPKTQASAPTAINGSLHTGEMSLNLLCSGFGFSGGRLTTFMNPLASDTYVCAKTLFQNTGSHGSRKHDPCLIPIYTGKAQADPRLRSADHIHSSTSTCHLMVDWDKLPPLSAHHTISHLLFSLLYF